MKTGEQNKSAAQQADDKDREIRRLTKQIEALLPYKVSALQRLRIEEAVHMNLVGIE